MLQLRDMIGFRVLGWVTCGHERSWRSEPGKLLDLVHIRLDGVTFRFNKRIGQDGDSWLSAIQTLSDPQPHPLAHVFEPARVVEVRWRSAHMDDDVVYAIDQETGLVIFELGTEWSTRYEELMFVWECKPEGYLPEWLAPVDPDPPIEIQPKAKHAGDRTRKRTPTGHRAYPRST